MKYIDLHSDTILPILEKGENSSLLDEKSTDINIEKLIKASNMAQAFAVWLPDPSFDKIDIDKAFNPQNHEEDMEYIELAINRLNKEIEKNSDKIAWGENSAKIRENYGEGKVSAILTMEDARAFNGSLDNVEKFAKDGFKMISLLWNEENSLGYPNSKDPKINELGLKDFGIEAIKLMEDLNILIDISHLNDGGIWDVISNTKSPIIASHSNSRAIVRHQRNLTDEMIKKISDSGGVIGVCISPRFVNGYESNVSKISDMIRHLDHIYDVGGEDVLAIGTDFDGTSGDIELNSPLKMPLLFEALEEKSWPLERIEKLAYKNALRIFE